MKIVAAVSALAIAVLIASGARVGAAGDETALLPEGPGKAEVVASCQLCHSLTVITSQRLSERAWLGSLTKMEGWGAPLPPADNAKVAAYLAKYFNPDVPEAPDVMVPAPKQPG